MCGYGVGGVCVCVWVRESAREIECERVRERLSVRVCMWVGVGVWGGCECVGVGAHVCLCDTAHLLFPLPPDHRPDAGYLLHVHCCH